MSATLFFLAPFTVGGNTSSRNAIASDRLPYYYMGVNTHCKGYGAGVNRLVDSLAQALPQQACITRAWVF